MAGWPLNKGTEYYKLAAGKAKEVIDGVENHIYNYALLDEYSQVYSWEYNNKNKELLLGIYYNRDQTNQAAPLTDFLQDMAQGGWGRYQWRNQILESFSGRTAQRCHLLS